VMAVIFMGMALAMVLADFEMNPISNRWLSSPHTRVEMRAFIMKSIMTISTVVLADLLKVQALVLTISAFYLWWSYVRWVSAMV
jgi:hypothetical protein